MWENIKKGSSLLLFLSFPFFSAGDNFRISAGIERATTELVETVDYEEAAFPLFQCKCIPLKPKLVTSYLSFHFDVFRLKQDQNIYRNYLKQERVITGHNYVLPLKKVIPFSIKEPLSFSC